MVRIVVLPPAVQDSALGIETLKRPRAGQGREYVKGGSQDLSLDGEFDGPLEDVRFAR